MGKMGPAPGPMCIRPAVRISLDAGRIAQYIWSGLVGKGFAVGREQLTRRSGGMQGSWAKSSREGEFRLTHPFQALIMVSAPFNSAR